MNSGWRSSRAEAIHPTPLRTRLRVVVARLGAVVAQPDAVVIVAMHLDVDLVQDHHVVATTTMLIALP
jgi:hypothetical protein